MGDDRGGAVLPRRAVLVRCPTELSGLSSEGVDLRTDPALLVDVGARDRQPGAEDVALLNELAAG
ncbi:hypothetical protein ACFVAV_17545 [Nocardia sp. NPDC057663]|uniref:hypothetical protein n=1 Tax=Nocardia sp. NPDC057663 TaxID=3346201 RepID=UPI003673488E